jgi:predicted KAP-like P-loop ATPase
MSGSWPDSPIRESSEDILDRDRFAQTVAEAISSTRMKADSTVFGLVAPWGGGKSSVIRMILQGLPDSWSSQVFAPWAANDPSSLQFAFLNALNAAIGTSKKAQAAHASVKKYVRWALPLLNLVPVVGLSASEVASAMADDLLAAPPWDEAFEEVSKRLRKLDRQVLLVYDDIDRLDATELMEFLKTVG